MYRVYCFIYSCFMRFFLLLDIYIKESFYLLFQEGRQMIFKMWILYILILWWEVYIQKYVWFYYIFTVWFVEIGFLDSCFCDNYREYEKGFL